MSKQKKKINICNREVYGINTKDRMENQENNKTSFKIWCQCKYVKKDKQFLNTYRNNNI